jgi:hypothetical protein
MILNGLVRKLSNLSKPVYPLFFIIIFPSFSLLFHGSLVGHLVPLPRPRPSRSAFDGLVATEVPVKMDHLGPVILNDDGSMRRIANWLLGGEAMGSGHGDGPWW